MTKSEKIEVSAQDDQVEAGGPETSPTEPVREFEVPHVDAGIGAEGERSDEEGAVVEPNLDPEALQAKLATLEAALVESQEFALRAQAELENLRRRAQRDVQNAHKYGVEKIVSEMLPVIDSMELGLKAVDQEGASGASLKEGIELTLKMLQSALAKFDVAEVSSENLSFDPELHQAMTVQEVEGAEPGTIVQVFQKGYTLAGRLVRPAMVVVAK